MFLRVQRLVGSGYMDNRLIVHNWPVFEKRLKSEILVQADGDVFEE